MATDRLRKTPSGAADNASRPRLSIRKGADSRDASSDSGSGRESESGSRVSAMDVRRQPKGNRKRNMLIGVGAVAVLVSGYLYSTGT